MAYKPKKYQSITIVKNSKSRLTNAFNLMSTRKEGKSQVLRSRIFRVIYLSQKSLGVSWNDMQNMTMQIYKYSEKNVPKNNICAAMLLNVIQYQCKYVEI